MDDAAILRIRRRLELLREVDADHHAFGASHHEYALEPPLDEVALAAFERAAGVALPEDYRAFLLHVGRSGAGPYYGLRGLPEGEARLASALSSPFVGDAAPDDDGVMKEPSRRGGALFLADQGCGYKSLLVLVGPKRGQLWADHREAHEGFVFEGASFLEWYEHWLDRALVEWAIRALPGLIGHDEGSPAIAAALEVVRTPLVALTRPGRDLFPWERLFPLAERDLIAALLNLCILHGKDDEARALVDRVVAVGGDDAPARGLLARARIARAGGRETEALRLADEGLLSPSLWFATRTELYEEKEWALGLLGRHRERIATILERAKHTGNRFAYFDAAWAALEEGDVPGATEALLAAAPAGETPARAESALATGDDLFAALAGSELAPRGKELRASLERLARPRITKPSTGAARNGKT